MMSAAQAKLKNSSDTSSWGTSCLSPPFHVHPNTGSWQPSTPGNNAEGNKYGDTGYADLYNYQIYVMSRAGLGMYDPATKQSSLLRPNLDWTKPCGH